MAELILDAIKTVITRPDKGSGVVILDKVFYEVSN